MSKQMNAREWRDKNVPHLRGSVGIEEMEAYAAYRRKGLEDEHYQIEVEIHDKIDIALERLGNELSHEQGMDDLRELRDSLPPCTPKLEALAALAAAKEVK